MIEAILHLSKKYHGNWNKIYHAITSRERIEILTVDRNKEKFFFITENDYPDKLKEILAPPFFMYYEGRADLINKDVLSINGDISFDEFEKLLEEQNSNKYVLCLDNHELKKEIFDLVMKKNREVIVVCEGGISSFKYYKDYKNLLLISEYNDPQNYDPCDDQTVQRLMFAMSNKIYVSKVDKIETNNLLFNLQQVKKPIYYKESQKLAIDNLNLTNTEMFCIQNIQDVI